MLAGKEDILVKVAFLKNQFKALLFTEKAFVIQESQAIRSGHPEGYEMYPQ